MLPKTLALIDDDEEYVDFLAQHLREQGVQVSSFTDSTELLAHPDGFGFDFYVVDLMLPGGGELDLISVLRKRSNAGVVVERELLRQRLGRTGQSEGGKDGLNAVVLRLRRRIERTTPALVPLQAKSGVGCVFRAPLRAV